MDDWRSIFKTKDGYIPEKKFVSNLDYNEWEVMYDCFKWRLLEELKVINGEIVDINPQTFATIYQDKISKTKK